MSGGHVIKQGMQVLGSDGGMVGTVDEALGDRIKLQRPPSGGPAHSVPTLWVARVDTHVHLDRSAATVRDRWSSEGEKAAGAGTATAAKGESLAWLWWSLAALLLIGVLYVLLKTYEEGSRGSAREHEGIATQSAPELRTADPAPVLSGGLAREVQAYMDSRQATPRTFTFENLHFDTASAAIPRGAEGELGDVASVLAPYPDARLRVVGYADARGDQESNEDLGMRARPRSPMRLPAAVSKPSGSRQRAAARPIRTTPTPPARAAPRTAGRN